jgi:hypothetical protein
MTKTSYGPIGVGTTWHAVSKMFDRRVAGGAESIGFEPNRVFSMKSASPFPTTMTYTFESVAAARESTRSSMRCLATSARWPAHSSP